ncbi:DUF551 domain-containing protein [Salmonella enterica]
MTTITKERIELFIKNPLENGLTRGEQMELARIALAALEAEKGADPVVFTDERNLRHIARGRETSLIWGKQNQEVGDIPLYRHAQPVPVGNEFIPKNLDKALGVVGVALPESKEEFNFQIERWIQLLIDRVIRYADEFKEQPAPVVPEEHYQRLSELYHAQEKRLFKIAQRIKGPAFDKYSHSPSQAIDVLESALFGENEATCRAAMLQGSQPVSQTYKLNELSGNSPVTQDGWISCSERMPEQGAYISAVSKHGEYVAGQVIDDWLDLHDGTSFGLDEVYLWMMLPPLLASPQQ